MSYYEKYLKYKKKYLDLRGVDSKEHIDNIFGENKLSP